MTIALRPLLATVVDHFTEDLNIFENDNLEKQRQKVGSARRLASLAVECTGKGVERVVVKGCFQELLYQTCKNGNFGCFNMVFTAEEMMVLSISEEFGCMHGDRNLELSAIILLVLVKVVVYNILEKPEDIAWESHLDWRASSDIQFPTVFANLQLIGNILY